MTTARLWRTQNTSAGHVATRYAEFAIELVS
jgi:hypothetical protein